MKYVHRYLPRVLALVVCLFCFGTHAFAQSRKFSVYFPTGVHKLSLQSTSTIDSLFYVELIQSAKQIRIVGYADDPGSSSANSSLSQRRADAVKDYLVASGIKAERIVEVSGKGDTMVAVKENANATDRRADIILEYKAAEVAKVSPMKKDAALTNQLKQVKQGETLTLEDLLFIGGLSKVLPSSEGTLQTLLAVMKERPRLRICLEGHVCCEAGISDGVDGETGMRDLSYKRAMRVYNYLVDGGINKDRLCAKGFGHSRPKINPELSPDDQRRNRRVEVRVLQAE